MNYFSILKTFSLLILFCLTAQAETGIKKDLLKNCNLIKAPLAGESEKLEIIKFKESELSMIGAKERIAISDSLTVTLTNTDRQMGISFLDLEKKIYFAASFKGDAVLYQTDEFSFQVSCKE